jgi:hypothetical protein
MGTVRIRGIGTYVNRMHTKCMGEMYGVSPRDRFRKFANLNCVREYFSDGLKTQNILAIGNRTKFFSQILYRSRVPISVRITLFGCWFFSNPDEDKRN